MKKYIKHKGMWFIQEPIITSQYLGMGKTKRLAKIDFNNNLKEIFSDKREVKLYKIKL